MPLSIADTESRATPSLVDRLLSAPAASPARIDPAELSQPDNLPPQLLVHPEIGTGAILVCPMCEAPVHLQLTACQVMFPRPQTQPDADPHP